MRACTQTSEHVCVRLHILPNLHTVYACVCVCGGGGGGLAGGGGGCMFVCVYAFVRAGDSVSARVQCLSVCQFDFALYHYICVVICYYANDFF